MAEPKYKATKIVHTGFDWVVNASAALLSYTAQIINGVVQNSEYPSIVQAATNFSDVPSAIRSGSLLAAGGSLITSPLANYSPFLRKLSGALVGGAALGNLVSATFAYAQGNRAGAILHGLSALTQGGVAGQLIINPKIRLRKKDLEETVTSGSEE